MIPTLAAISAHYRAAEMVPVLHLLTIFSFLLALQLEHSSSPSITLGRVAWSTFIVRRMAVEDIRGPFTIGGSGTYPLLF